MHMIYFIYLTVPEDDLPVGVGLRFSISLSHVSTLSSLLVVAGGSGRTAFPC